MPILLEVSPKYSILDLYSQKTREIPIQHLKGELESDVICKVIMFLRFSLLLLKIEDDFLRHQLYGFSR